jgi:predicted transcriptional regulator
MRKDQAEANTPTAVFPVRVPVPHLSAIGKLAKKADQTKGAVIREAIAEYLERKAAS